MRRTLRVLLVAPNASESMGGEAILPLHWLRELRELGVEAELLTHARCRRELEQRSQYAGFPILFLEDSSAEFKLWKLGNRLGGISSRLCTFLLDMVATWRLGREVTKLNKKCPYDLIHQVTPVSPRLPSPVTSRSTPVIIGPLNGNMKFPDGFADSYGGASEGIARKLSEVMHTLFAGKPRAARVLVANQRTAQGLPKSVHKDRILHFVENGVDLSRWREPSSLPDPPVRFVFVGRLVRWKAVDILIEAAAKMKVKADLLICGDGEERLRLEQLAEELDICDRIFFLGQVPQEKVVEVVASCHCLVLPSLYECGGAVILEAMAMKRAVIGPDWGGPADYVTPESGILVKPSTRQDFMDQLANGMDLLASDLEKIQSFGEAGRNRIEKEFSWQEKGKQMLDIYDEVLAEGK